MACEGRWLKVFHPSTFRLQNRAHILHLEFSAVANHQFRKANTTKRGFGSCITVTVEVILEVLWQSQFSREGSVLKG